MSTNLPHLAQRLFNTPLAILPDKAEVVTAALADRFGVAHLFSRSTAIVINGNQVAFDQDESTSRRARDVGYTLTADGIACVPVCGTLVAKLGCVTPYSGMTGYDGIRHNVLCALNDPQVRAIILDIDSPGGEVAGVFDLADMIYAARDIKPIWAVLNECAFSAAYALASAASRITVPRTGGTGSIGVIWMHTDFSRALDKEGISVTLVTFGALKADRSPYEPLPDAVRARVQAEVDATGRLFVNTVARNRDMPADKVTETEAGCFRGPLGVEAGLADAVMAPDEAYRALVSSLA